MSQLSEIQLAILEKMVVTPEAAFITSEFVDDLDYTAEGVRYNLEQLEDDGYISRKKPGKRTVMYWIEKKGREAYAEQSG